MIIRSKIIQNTFITILFLFLTTKIECRINYLNSLQKNNSIIWNREETWILTSGRKNFTCYQGRVLFPYGPECADIELSKDLTRSEVINLGFNLTFMGHRFEKAWVNQHGLVSFQESFLGQTLSQEDWPHPKYPYVDDPVFIAPLYAQTDLAGDKIDDLTSTKYGRILYKVIRRMDLPQQYTEEEKFIYQITMKVLDEGQVFEATEIFKNYFINVRLIKSDL